MRNRSFIILTMRSDFYSKVADYKPLAEAVTRNQMLVSPMTERELREAILLPAEAVGLELEKALVEKLLDDTRDAPGVLPLLQHALLELFHRRNGNLLTLDAYNEIDGVKGALAFRADAILDSMPMEQRHIVRRILMRLVQPGEGTTNTRRRATFSEVLPQGHPVSEVENIIQTLIEANLIVTSRHPENDEMVLDVSHEALIKEWPRFQSWLDWDRQGLRIRQQLSQAARDWDKRGRDEDSLYRGVRLLEVEEWVASNPGEINPLEQTFLTASIEVRDRIRTEERKRTRNLIIRLTIGLIIVTIGAVFGFVGQYQANQESKRANEAQQTAEAARIKAEHQARIATANQLAAQSQIMDEGSSSLPLILAREAVYATWLTDTEVITQRFVTEEADVALRQVIEEAEELGWRMTLPQNWTRRHTDGANSAVFSPDGTMIVSAGKDETIWLWDAQTDEALRVFIGHTDQVNSAAFSPDGTMIVSASHDGTARVWDALTGDELRVFEGHTAGINAAAFSPDGATIVTASGEHASGTTDNTIRVWNVSTGEELRVFEGHTAEVTSAAFSPDGGTIVSAGHDQTVRLWDVQSGEQLQVLAGHTAEVKSVAFSPDGTMIVSASHDGTARVWDAQTGEQLQVLAGHTGRLNAAAFSPDGASIVTSSEGHSEPNHTEKPDDTVRVWNVQTGEELLVLAGHTAGVTSAAFSPDGKMIVSASGDRTVRLWDAQTGEELRTPEGHTAGVTAVAFSPDGSTLASTSNDETVRVWDAQTGEELRVLRGHQGSVHAVAFSPDGDTIASASDDQTVRLWNARTGEEQGILQGHGAGVTSVAFSPDGAPGGVTLVSGSHDGEIWQWDAQTGQQLRRLEGHRAGVTAVAFSPDGKMIASASTTPPFEETESPDNTVRVWDAQTGEELRVLEGHTEGVTSVAFSPDSRTIVSGSHDKTVRMWDVQTGESLGVFEGHRGGVTSVTFSPNGATLVSVGNGTLREWDVQSGQERRRFESRTAGPNSAVFSPDGNTIVTTNNDHTLQVWNVHVEKRVQKFGSHRATVTSAAFSPDGATLVSADGEGRMQVWDVWSGERLLALESSKSGAVGGAEAEGFQQPQGQENLSQINAVTFSPDGTTIASAGNDGAIRLWDAGLGQELQVLESDKDGVTGSTSGQQPQLPKNLIQVNAVSYSPDGATLVSASSDGTVQIWDVQTGQQRQVFEDHATGVNTVAFSPDGSTLVSGGSDGTVRVWNVQTGQQGQVFEDKSGVTWVAFSPDGRSIVSGSNEGTIRVWDVQTGQQRQVLEGHPAKITSVVYSPDGTTIVSTGMDQTMRVWDVQTGQELRVLGGHGFGFYSPDGATIISSAGDSVELWMADIEDLLELADSLIQRRLHTLTGSERERFGLE